MNVFASLYVTESDLQAWINSELMHCIEAGIS